MVVCACRSGLSVCVCAMWVVGLGDSPTHTIPSLSPRDPSRTRHGFIRPLFIIPPPFTIHHSSPSPFPSRFLSTHQEFGEALISIAASIETGSGGAGEGGRGDLAPIKESGGGASFTPQEVATLVEHFDLNDDGEVDYDEFMDLIQPQSAAGYEGKHSGSGGGKK